MSSPTTKQRSNSSGRTLVPVVRGNKKRITLWISTILHRNVEIYASVQGMLKTKVVEEALSEYLKTRGLDPTKLPRVQWSGIGASEDGKAET